MMSATATAFTFCEAFPDIQWKTTGFRRKPCAGIISGDRLVRVCTLLGIRKTCRKKSAMVGKKGVQERGFKGGNLRGKRGRKCRFLSGLVSSSPFFTLGFPLWQQSCELSQLDRFSRCRLLRSLTAQETHILPSLNRVFLGTEFSGRIVKYQVYMVH